MTSSAIKLAVLALVAVAAAVAGFSALRWVGTSPAAGVALLAGAIASVLGVYWALFRQASVFRSFRTILVLAAALVALALVVDGGVDLAARFAAGGFREMLAAGPLTKIVGAVAILMVLYFGLIAPTTVRRSVENIFSIPELVKKLGFTLALLCIYRIGYHIPLPGLNPEALTGFMSGADRGTFGRALQYFTMFSGGNLSQSTLFGLGIMPYISASIILQLLVTVVPSLERLAKEGQAGYRKIQEYTRYATVGLCIVQAVVWMRFVESQRLLYPEYQDSYLIRIMGIVGLTTGTMFLMWLGEQIDEYGIGNGISLIIMAGIVSRLPNAIFQLANMASLKVTGGTGKIGVIELIFLAAAFVFVVAGSILITQAQRRIPIQQAKQTRGRRVYGGQRQYLPLRVNHGGVMPIIFASSLMIFPGLLARQFHSWFPQSSVAFHIYQLLSNDSLVYQLLYVGMIFFFAYFWTTIQFRPKDMSDQLQENGSFIPGLRPGRRTAEYLERVMERITYCGAGFLAAIAVIPQVIAGAMQIPWGISAFLGGTGLLIMVSVGLDLVQRIEANLIMRNYGGFLAEGGRIKGAYA